MQKRLLSLWTCWFRRTLARDAPYRASLLLPHTLADSLTQPPVGAKEPQAHGDGRYAEPGRDFVRRVLKNVAQQTDLAQVWRKSSYCSGHQSTHFLSSVQFFRIFRAGS